MHATVGQPLVPQLRKAEARLPPGLRCGGQNLAHTGAVLSPPPHCRAACCGVAGLGECVLPWGRGFPRLQRSVLLPGFLRHANEVCCAVRVSDHERKRYEHACRRGLRTPSSGAARAPAPPTSRNAPGRYRETSPSNDTAAACAAAPGVRGAAPPGPPCRCAMHAERSRPRLLEHPKPDGVDGNGDEQ